MKKVNNILKMISKMESNANEVKLGKHEVELALVDEIKSASDSVKKQYDIVFQKAMTSLSNINEGVKLGNKAFFEAQKFYQQGLKIEQQAKDLGVQMPNDFLNAMKILYQYSNLEGEQIIKDLIQAQKALS
jgi:hypothetical protein